MSYAVLGPRSAGAASMADALIRAELGPAQGDAIGLHRVSEVKERWQCESLAVIAEHLGDVVGVVTTTMSSEVLSIMTDALGAAGQLVPCAYDGFCIEAVVVSSEWCGRGIGTRLVSEVLSASRSRWTTPDAAYCASWVEDDVGRSNTILTRAGFVRVGRALGFLGEACPTCSDADCSCAVDLFRLRFND